MPSTADLLTTKQVAELAGTNRRTVTKWAIKGHLPVAYKVEGDTGSRLFDPAAVARFLAARSASPEGENK